MTQNNDRVGAGTPSRAEVAKASSAGSGGAGSMTSSGPAALPAVSLPKGGGALKGLGEKFATNRVTGTGKFTIPLPVSPGRAGFTPALALDYDSGTGSGPYRFGWSVGYAAVNRPTGRGL